MSDLNRCEFIGRLGKDIELKTSKAGKSYTNFSVAVNEHIITQTGEFSKSTIWLNCVAFGNAADKLSKYAAKGSQIYIAGKLKIKIVERNNLNSTEEFERPSILVDQIQILSSSKITTPKNEAAINTTNEAITVVGASTFDDDVPY